MQSEEMSFQSAFERGQRLGCSDVHRKVIPPSWRPDPSPPEAIAAANWESIPNMFSWCLSFCSCGAPDALQGRDLDDDSGLGPRSWLCLAATPQAFDLLRSTTGQEEEGGRRTQWTRVVKIPYATMSGEENGPSNNRTGPGWHRSPTPIRPDISPRKAARDSSAHLVTLCRTLENSSRSSFNQRPCSRMCRKA